MNQQAVDQLTRRAALQLGTGRLGLSLPGYLAAARAGPAPLPFAVSSRPGRAAMSAHDECEAAAAAAAAGERARAGAGGVRRGQGCARAVGAALSIDSECGDD